MNSVASHDSEEKKPQMRRILIAFQNDLHLSLESLQCANMVELGNGQTSSANVFHMISHQSRSLSTDHGSRLFTEVSVEPLGYTDILILA